MRVSANSRLCYTKKRHMTATIIIIRPRVPKSCILFARRQIVQKREIIMLLTENKPQISIMADIQEHF